MSDLAVGLVLLGADEDETRLLASPGGGFSIPIPGHPVLVTWIPSGPPAYQAVVALGDLPVELGVRIDALPTGGEPQALAASLTQAYAMSRAQEVGWVAPLRGRLLGTGFHGGANTIYVQREVGTSPQMEHLHVHVHRDGGTTWAVYVTTRWASADVDVVRWAHLRSATAGQEQWDAATPRRTPPRLWPAHSSFADLDARLRLLPAAQSDAERMSTELGPLSEAEASTLVDALISTASGDDPPTAPVSEALIAAYVQRITARAPGRAVETLVRNTAGVRTFHDLRAWCWQAIWALGHRTGQRHRKVN